MSHVGHSRRFLRVHATSAYPRNSPYPRNGFSRSRCQRKTTAHRVEYGPANGEGQDGRRSRGRSYRTLVSGPRRRNLMPPCGSPLMRTTNSVSLPVSELNSSSEMIREDRGDPIRSWMDDLDGRYVGWRHDYPHAQLGHAEQAAGEVVGHPDTAVRRRISWQRATV